MKTDQNRIRTDIGVNAASVRPDEANPGAGMDGHWWVKVGTHAR